MESAPAIPKLTSLPGSLTQGNALGSTAELLDANAELIDSIRARLHAGNGGESAQLLSTLRENILTVMHRRASREARPARRAPPPPHARSSCLFVNALLRTTLVPDAAAPHRRMETMQGILAQMPPLPVQPNLGLAEQLLAPRMLAGH